MRHLRRPGPPLTPLLVPAPHISSGSTRKDLR